MPCSTECGASLAPAAGLSDAALARALCSLLRQLASSDSCKQLLVEGGALELLAALLAAHGGSPAVLEQALGMLTNVTLRYPEAAARVRLAGCARWALGRPGTRVLLWHAGMHAVGGSPAQSSSLAPHPNWRRPPSAAAWMRCWS